MTPALQSTLESAGRRHLRQRVLGLILKSLPLAAALILLIFAADILLHLGAGAREIIRNLLVALTAALLLAAAVAAFLRRQPLLRTVRLIEDRLPDLDSRLINILQLETQATDPAKPELTRELARRAIDDAARDLPLAKFTAVIRPPDLAKRLALAAIAPALLLLLTIAVGEPGARQWARFLDPHGDHPPLSFTTLAIIDPDTDDVAVPYRDSIDIRVRSGGHRPAEVFLTGTRDSGETLFTLPMTEFEPRFFRVQIDDIREPIRVHAHLARDAAMSTRRQIGVILNPRIERARATITPPVYTGRPPQDMPFRFAGIRALTGSEITFEIDSNRPLGEGRLIYEIPGKEPTEHPLAPRADDPAETAVATIPATATGRLIYHLVDVDGRIADETPASSITVTHDAEPSVSLLFPTENTFVVETMTIELIAEAADDIGLASIRLHTGIDGDFSEPETARFAPPGEPRHRLVKPLDLPALGLQAGQTISVFADAMDAAPEPQFSRTEQRTLTLITEDDYNNYLRRDADVSLIAGKYERALDRLREAIEDQKEIEAELAAAKDLPVEEAGAAIGEAIQRQDELNHRLEDIARELREVTRDNPVYDFERNLGESLEQRAAEIEASVAQNRGDMDDALDESATGTSVTPAELDALRQAATDHRERLEGEREQAEEEVREPLEDLAEFHEMLKNFNQLRNLAEQQREIAEAAAAADRGQPLTPEDKAALRDLANQQRELGQKLDQLQQKLRQDAERLRDEMPEVAEAAEQLADALDHGALPGQARDAAQDMLQGDAPGANQQANQLKQQLEDLFNQQGQAGQQAAAGALAQMLGGFGMGQGDNFQQLLQSLRFNPPGMDGAQGTGASGMMAQGMVDGQPQSLLGGESLAGGDIARRMAGIGGGPGAGGGPGSEVESTDLAADTLRSQRRTTTPEAATLLMEYEAIADAYFQRLTTPNP